MKYIKVGRYDYEKSEPVFAKGKPTANNRVDRPSRIRSGSVLVRCKCGGELVAIDSDKEGATCSCTKCGQMTYWDIEAQKAAA